MYHIYEGTKAGQQEGGNRYESKKEAMVDVKLLVRDARERGLTEYVVQIMDSKTDECVYAECFRARVNGKTGS
jgi:hypothetical protein